jgi:hypothetical protein
VKKMFLSKIFLCITLLLILIPATAEISFARKRPPFDIGDRARIFWLEQWRVCTIIDIEPGNYKIQFEEDERLLDRWVPVDKLENFTYKVGDIVTAELDGKWLKARIMAGSTLKYRVHFIGMEAKYNAWLGPDRIRDGKYDIGDVVLVLWKNHWYKARIIDSREGKFRVQFDGFPEPLNEWIGPEIIKNIVI